MPKVDISVLIATYKTPLTLLSRAVRSAQNQSGVSVEVIVVDDGIGINFESSTETVTYLQHKENQGPAAAWNTALDHAQGEFCILLGDDDYFAPGSLIPLFAAANANTYAYGDVKLGIGAIHSNPPWSKHKPGERLKTSYAVLFPTAYRNKGARFYAPPREEISRYVTDRDFILQLEQLGCEGVHVPVVVLHNAGSPRYGAPIEQYRDAIEAHLLERFSGTGKAVSRRLRVESPAPPAAEVTDGKTVRLPEPEPEEASLFEVIDEGDEDET